MPGMDGAELLSEIARRYPGVVRVILSGYSEPATVMRTVGPTHQFLAKPCPPQVLVSVLRRSLELSRLLSAEALRELLAGLKSLPTPSNTYFALVEYLNDPKSSANGIVQIIERDVGMTAELLKLTNSAYFSPSGRPASLLQAVRLLGFETLNALVLRIGIFRSFKGLPATGKLVEDLNRDSFLMARIARRIAKAENMDLRMQEEAYCAGMLCSIGLLVLLDQMPETLGKVSAALAAGDDFVKAQRSVLGATYMQVGAYLLGLWGFNNAVVEAVAFLERPGAVPTCQLDLAGVVHFARVLAGPMPAFSRVGQSGAAGQLALDQNYLEAIGLTDRLKVWSMEAAEEMGT
jgi:HD-like signal output (HDOD) protein